MKRKKKEKTYGNKKKREKRAKIDTPNTKT
jgi:hypothetical protein